MIEIETAFKNAGGITEVERQALMKEFTEAEHTKTESLTKIKMFVEGLMPFIILRDFTGRITEQLDFEEKGEIYYYVQQKLKRQEIKKALNEKQEVSEDTVEALMDFLLKKFKPKVSMYCGGCAKHKYPEMMEEGKFPLLLSVKGPKKTISAELNKLCQGENEVLVIEEEDDYSLMNRYISAGASIIVVEDTSIEGDFDLILNMKKQSDVMILGIKEYRDLCGQKSAYYISGGVIALYNSGEDKAYEFCATLRKYKNSDMRLIHIVKEDYFIQKVQKPISAMVEGPRIDSYILERM